MGAGKRKVIARIYLPQKVPLAETLAVWMIWDHMDVADTFQVVGFLGLVTLLVIAWFGWLVMQSTEEQTHPTDV